MVGLGLDIELTVEVEAMEDVVDWAEGVVVLTEGVPEVSCLVGEDVVGPGLNKEPSVEVGAMEILVDTIEDVPVSTEGVADVRSFVAEDDTA